MNKKIITTICAALLIGTTAQAQYGLIDNFQGGDSGAGGRLPFDINVTEGANGFFSFGSTGGGAGELADNGPNGVGDKAVNGGGGGDLSAGGYGYSIGFSDTIDRTQTINGMTSTGYTLDFLDGQSDGDTYFLRVESGGFDRSETFQFSAAATTTPLSGGWNRLTFTPGTGVLNTSGGAFDETALTGFVIGLTTHAGVVGAGDAAFNFDNVGFTGNLVPTSGDVEDFSSYTVAALADAELPLSNANNFGGAVEAFAFGGGTVVSGEIFDRGGGDLALRYNFTNGPGATGFFFDLGPIVGSQTDVGAYDTLELDLSVSEAGDVIEVIIEDINAPLFADRSTFVPTVGTTLQTIQIPFASFTSGSQGGIVANSDAVHRITLVVTNDQGNGATVEVDNVRFVDNSATIDLWQLFN